MVWITKGNDAVQEDLVPTARELGIGFLVYSPLGRGMLTGTLKSREDLGPLAAHNPRMAAENFEKVGAPFPWRNLPPFAAQVLPTIWRHMRNLCS